MFEMIYKEVAYGRVESYEEAEDKMIKLFGHYEADELFLDDSEDYEDD